MSCALVLAIWWWPASAAATPHPLPFSYNYETLPADQLEIEQYADLVPTRVLRDNGDGTQDRVFDTGATLVTEIEYGLTDRIEAGFYFQFEQSASAGSPGLTFDGVKQRLRFRLGEPGKWPVDVGLYVELAELHDELELEEKLLLQRRFGNLTAVVNLWIEHEYELQDSKLEHLYNPTVGVSYELSPKLFVGLEYWARGNFESEEGEAVHYLGPTFMAQSGKVFLSLGAYARLDNLGEASKVDDPFGKLWFRTLIGVEL